MPLWLLPEIKLPAPVTVPPIVAYEALVKFRPILVAQGHGAGHIGADVVALDERIVAGTQRDAIAGITGDDVSGQRGGSADRCVVSSVLPDAVVAVGEGTRAAGIEADDVARDQRARVVGLDESSYQVDAALLVARDQIALACRAPADCDPG